MAAIKAAQMGLRVRVLQFCSLTRPLTFSTDRVYREARRSRRNMSERRLHSLKSDAQQLAHVPPGPARHEEARD